MKKSVSSLLPALTGYELLPPADHTASRPPLSFMVTALCYDSRKAIDTCLFFCLPGAQADGHVFAPSAYAAGVRFFVVEKRVDLPDDALQICVPDARAALADCAGAFYDHPDRELRLIGVTGTKGKTTTAALAAALLCASGIPAGYIGTNGIDFAGRHFPTVNSTPESLEIAHYLRCMVDEGIRVCVMEVSSQGLWMGRVRGLHFAAALYTNLSPDHIGGHEHPDFAHYAASKRRLFTDCAPELIIANADDPHAPDMVRGASAPVVWYGTRRGFTRPGAQADPGTTVPRADTPAASDDASAFRPRLSWIAAEITPTRQGGRPGTAFACAHAGMILGGTHFLPLPGDFNVRNALGAMAIACEVCGLSDERALTALRTSSVPGRFETLTFKEQPDVTYIIDYAHNGASLAAILDALRRYAPGRILCLFGSVGGRTLTRRRDLAEAAGHRADLCILTADNPGIEPPEQTIREIDAAFPDGSCPRLLIPDRADAIREAVRLARPGDFVLLAGKGHEEYQLIGREKVAFREKEIILQSIASMQAILHQ